MEHSTKLEENIVYVRKYNVVRVELTDILDCLIFATVVGGSVYLIGKMLR